MGEEESLKREIDGKGTDSSNCCIFLCCLIFRRDYKSSVWLLVSLLMSLFSGVRVPALQHLYPIFLYSAWMVLLPPGRNMCRGTRCYVWRRYGANGCSWFKGPVLECLMWVMEGSLTALAVAATRGTSFRAGAKNSHWKQARFIILLPEETKRPPAWQRSSASLLHQISWFKHLIQLLLVFSICAIVLVLVSSKVLLWHRRRSEFHFAAQIIV